MDATSRYLNFNYLLGGGLSLLAVFALAWRPGDSASRQDVPAPSKGRAVNGQTVSLQPMPTTISIASIVGGGSGRPTSSASRASASSLPGARPEASLEATREIVSLDVRSSALPRVDPIGVSVPSFDVLTALPSPSLDGIRIAATGRGGAGFALSSSPGKGAGSAFPVGPSGLGDGSGSGMGSAGGTGNGVGNDDQVDQPPREPAGNAQPEFPERERRLGIESEVVVRLLIDETGRVEKIEFVSGPAAFREAVAGVAKSWRFEPARHRGRAVKVWAIKEVGFTLRRGRS